MGLYIDWHRIAPLSRIDGPARTVRANNVRLAPPLTHCPKRNNFLSIRIAGLLKHLPNGIMDCNNVNIFKNTYDSLTKKIATYL